MTPPATGLTRRPILLSQVVFFAFLAVKIYTALNAPPVGDEAYYWMWGQKLAWSYFDHPPLHAWLLRLMDVIFGWNLFSLRALTWATFGGSLWILWLFSKRLQPDDAPAWFWPTAAIYVSSPLFFIMTGISFHDHLLIFLCFASGYLFLIFAERWEVTGGGFAWLYAAAAVLGLAVLTKYNGVLLGLGVALFFAARRETRPLFRSPHLYLAALLSVAIQAPVFWWNLTEGFASYRFHLAERWEGESILHFTPIFFVEFCVLLVSMISPFMFPAIVDMALSRIGKPFIDRTRLLGLCVLLVSTVVLGVL